MEETKSNLIYYTYPELREECVGYIEETKIIPAGTQLKSLNENVKIIYLIFGI